MSSTGMNGLRMARTSDGWRFFSIGRFVGVMARILRRYWLGAPMIVKQSSMDVCDGLLWTRQRPLLSVVIPCFDDGEFVIDALRSLARQTFQDFEVCIVDDGSSDLRTIRALNRLAKWVGIPLLRQVNAGPGGARNAGIARSRGRYICCLDADDYLAPDYFEKCLLLLEADSGVGLAYSWLQLFGDEQRLCRTENLDIELLRFVNHLGGAAIFRRDDWLAVGGYAERKDCLYEDWDFWIRLATRGIRGRVIPEPLHFYRRHGITRLRQANQRAWEMHSQLRRHHPVFFSDRAWRRELRRRQVSRPVVSPLLNLSRPTQYGSPESGVYLLHLHAGETTPSRDAIESLPSGVSLQVVVEHTARLPAWLVQRADLIYRLPWLLDRRHWSAFVENFWMTRRVVCALRPEGVSNV